MRTLVLNAGYEPMLLINWQRAICLVLSEKAEVVAEYDRDIRTVKKQFTMPSVVRLTRYVRFVRRFGVVRCTRKNILLRDKMTCQYCSVRCNQSSASIDHIVPRSKGGRTTWENVVVACHSCNRRKGNKNLKESGFRLARRPWHPTWREIVGGGADYPIESSWLDFIDQAG